MRSPSSWEDRETKDLREVPEEKAKKNKTNKFS